MPKILFLSATLVFLPFAGAFAGCPDVVNQVKAFLKIPNTTAYYKTQRLEALWREAKECDAPFQSVQIRFVLKRLSIAARDCAQEARALIASEVAHRGVKQEIEDLRYCGLLSGKNPGEVEMEAKRLQQASEVEWQKRKGMCADAAVDTSAMGPPRNQGDIGWCYAHTAADLISHQLGRRVSAIDIAMEYNDSEEFRKLKKEGSSEFSKVSGFVSQAISKMMDKGFCADEDLRGDADNARSAIEYYRRIEKLKDAVESSEILSNDTLCDLGFGWVQKVMKDVSAKEFLDVLYLVPREDIFAAFRDISCGKRIVLDKKRAVLKSVYPTEKNFRMVDGLLDRKKPVGVSYRFSLIDKKKNSSAHANVLVGRKFDEKTGECLYQIRNTWGANWDKDGHFWVSRKKLFNNLDNFTYFE